MNIEESMLNIGKNSLFTISAEVFVAKCAEVIFTLSLLAALAHFHCSKT